MSLQETGHNRHFHLNQHQHQHHHHFVLEPISLCLYENPLINTRAVDVLFAVYEATHSLSHYDYRQQRQQQHNHSSHSSTSVTVHNYEDLLHQVSTLFMENPHDIFPIQLLYAYFVRVGSSHMEQTLQDLGNYWMSEYALSFDEAQDLLTRVVRRLAAVGRLRQHQRSGRRTS